MEKEGLLQKLGRKYLPFIAAGTMLFSSCDRTPTSPDPVNGNGTDPYTPTTVLEVDPKEGFAPLDSRIALYGEHSDGAEAIDKYILKIEGEIIERDSPIDTLWTLSSSGNYDVKGITFAYGKSDTAKTSIKVNDSELTAILDADPKEGYAPLEVMFQCSGDHSKGEDKIKNYILNTEINKIESDSPIVYSENFESWGKYNSTCTVHSTNGKSDSQNITISVDNPESPVAILDVSQKSGIVPHKTTVSVSGDHPESFDITEYHVKVNGEKSTSQSPIEESYIFTAPGESKVSAWVTDSNGENSDTLRSYINLEDIVASLELTGDSQHPVDLRASASVGNASDFIMKLFRNGESEPLATETFSGDHEGTFNYQNHGVTKGEYTAVLEPTDSELQQNQNLKKQRSAEVPNYDPIFNSSGLNFELDEEGQVIKNLESRISDPNPEDNPTITSAVSLDGKTSVGVEGNNLTLNGSYDEYGNFSIQKEISDGHGGKTVATIPGYLHPLARVSGIVKNVEDENLAGEKSKIEIYDENWNPIETKTENENGFSLTDNQGNFNIKLNKRASEISDLEMLILQAAHGTPGNRAGFWRTEYIPSDLTNPESHNYNPNIILMGVSKGEHPEEFREFLEQVGHPNKFNFNGNEKIRILDHGYCEDDVQNFDQDKQHQIKSLVLSPDHVSKFIGNYQIKEDQIVFGNDLGGDYTVNCNTSRKKSNIIPKEEGVIVVAPRMKFDTGGTAGEAVPYKSGTIVRRGVIYMRPDLSEKGTDGVTTHEFGHVFLTSWHPEDPFNKSIMSASSEGRSTAGEWDEKAGRILYHELNSSQDYSTFIRLREGLQYPDFDSVRNILGTEVGSKDKFMHKDGVYWIGN